MPPVHIVAVFTPAPGQTAKVRELLQAQCSSVHQKEDYAQRFMLTEQINTDKPDFCLFETYTSEQATQRHMAEPHFADLMKALNEDTLLAKPPSIWKTNDVAGFDLDKKFFSSL